MIDVCEIFASIQGESTHAGRPCTFVRLTGCNLSCRWCDTPYARERGEGLEVSAIVEKVLGLGLPLVEVTGGEPLLQPETPGLVSALLDAGLEVLVETNGSFDITVLDRRARIICDVKCPSSGEHGKNRLQNLDALLSHDEAKFVIGDDEDFNYAVFVLKERPDLASACRAVHFSPVFGVCDPVRLAARILASKLSVRMGFQLHKQIWDPAARGV